MRYLTAASLAIVAAIHRLASAGVLGVDRFESLYGICADESTFAILPWHRAVLFGLLGALLVYAASRPAVQATAVAAGFVSVASFLWLALATGGYNDAVGRVVTADLVALGCLLVGAVSLAGSKKRD